MHRRRGRHARDADTIVGDNGNIIRIVGTNGTPRRRRRTPASVDASSTTTTTTTHAYDANEIVVRGVHLLDYTPGGPDFIPTVRPRANPLQRRCGERRLQPPIATCYTGAGTAANGSTARRVGGATRSTASPATTRSTPAAATTSLFGDAQDDDMIGGWGDDWISGGTGQDGVLGDDGRIFTSRNTGSPARTAGRTTLLQRAALRHRHAPGQRPGHARSSNGNVLNEFIYTPGEVQTATINVAGALKKAVDITPFNLTPNATPAASRPPLFDANNADDIIFGGWDDDFLHGASGDDAIAGGEALIGVVRPALRTPTGDARPASSAPTGRGRSTRGDMLHFGADVDAVARRTTTERPRQGEFRSTTSSTRAARSCFNGRHDWAARVLEHGRRTGVRAARCSTSEPHRDDGTTALGCVRLRRTARASRSRPSRPTATTRSSATSATTGSSAAPARTRSGAAGATTC